MIGTTRERTSSLCTRAYHIPNKAVDEQTVLSSKCLLMVDRQ